MKIAVCAVLIGTVPFFCSSNNIEELKDGDIVFQRSLSNQSEMVKTVTGSNLTHCGVVFHKDSRPMVIEAVSPVKITPLDKWIDRGQFNSYKVVRYKNGLTEDQLKAMHNYGKRQLGKKYDLRFQWSDSKIYCSELVWKMYKAAGIELCELNKFSDYNINNNLAKKAIKQRYGNSINMNEPVVAPIDLYNSNLVRRVY